MAFTVIFSYRLFMASLIRKLFHFRPRFPSEFKKVKKAKGGKKEKPKRSGTSMSESFMEVDPEHQQAMDGERAD